MRGLWPLCRLHAFKVPYGCQTEVISVVKFEHEEQSSVFNSSGYEANLNIEFCASKKEMDFPVTKITLNV
jgi:hypothetical protein